MFSFGYYAPVKRLARRIVSEMTYIVSSGTLNPLRLILSSVDQLGGQSTRLSISFVTVMCCGSLLRCVDIVCAELVIQFHSTKLLQNILCRLQAEHVSV